MFSGPGNNNRDRQLQHEAGMTEVSPGSTEGFDRRFGEPRRGQSGGLGRRGLHLKHAAWDPLRAPQRDFTL